MSYGGNADPSGIQVTFLDQTGAKSVKAVIAFSVPVSRIIPNIITKMSLPATSPDGQPMSYSLDHKEGGRRLLESWTLVEAGVQNGDHLIVYPEVVAGRDLSGSDPRPSAATVRSPAHRLRPGRSTMSRHQEALASTQGALHDHVPIPSHAPAPQRPGGPRAAPVGELGLPVHAPGRPAAALSYLVPGQGFVARPRQGQGRSRSITSRSSWARPIPGRCPRSAG